MNEEDVYGTAEEVRRELLIKAGILTEDGYYNKDNFPQAHKKDTAKGIIQGLIPVNYKVIQSYNSHVYFINTFNLTGTFRWYVLSGTETYPYSFGIYPDFRNGFETTDDAVNQLEIYLKATTN